MKNKRAQGISTSTIVLLILAVVVLVVLILGFTRGWSNLAPWLSSSNVDKVVVSCEAACTTNSKYDYCTMSRDLKTEDSELSAVTCNYLAEKQSVYGIDLCEAVSCEEILSDATSEAEAMAGCVNSGDMVQYLEGKELKTITCN